MGGVSAHSVIVMSTIDPTLRLITHFQLVTLAFCHAVRSWGRQLKVLPVFLLLMGCSKERLVTLTFPRADGNNDYWVCNPQGTQCHGRGDGDIPQDAYEPEMDLIVPARNGTHCPSGPARIEIVVEGSTVKRVGYECAAPRAPTTTPASPCNEADDSGPTGLPAEAEGAPTGLPTEEEGAVEAPSSPATSAEEGAPQ